MVASGIIAKPVRALGDFFGMTSTLRRDLQAALGMARVHPADVVRGTGVARADAMLTIPFTVLITFTINVLLVEIGAADFSGTGAALGTVTQTGPIVTVLVVAGAGATAMCADLGSRTIREELDALRVLGINPVQALVVPRVLAATWCPFCPRRCSRRHSRRLRLLGVLPERHAWRLRRGADPGEGRADVTALIKAALFGLAAGLIACYKGISVGGGPPGVGNAVNETVVYTFMALFVINVVATAVAVQGRCEAPIEMSHRPSDQHSRDWRSTVRRLGRRPGIGSAGRLSSTARRSQHSGPSSLATRSRSCGSSRRWVWAPAHWR